MQCHPFLNKPLRRCYSKYCQLTFIKQLFLLVSHQEVLHYLTCLHPLVQALGGPCHETMLSVMTTSLLYQILIPCLLAYIFHNKAIVTDFTTWFFKSLMTKQTSRLSGPSMKQNNYSINATFLQKVKITQKKKT